MARKILITGCSGSGKTTLATPFARLINGILLESDQIRQYSDPASETELSQAYRLCLISDGIILAGKVAVIVHNCATNQELDIINPDYVVWMDTIKDPGFDFEVPARVNYHVSAWFDDTHQQLFEVVHHYLNEQFKE